MLGPAAQRNCSSVLLCLGCWKGQMVGSLHAACCWLCSAGATYIALTLTCLACAVFHFTNMDEPAGVSPINHSFLSFRQNTRAAFKMAEGLMHF